ncbi:reverse transcriptase domain-containing protein [Caerostris darwini]|uniref:Reverse transcriptase domain-containing protein n=1 Tax=Caerostris darwini TaxID=1538125 RepID=A0AAV4RJX6_9ARAC|nr:reverse transcriptase domain-containing protein [Caerostris darwini]
MGWSTRWIHPSCPNDIVLYEADLQPLSLRRSSSLVKYYGKLCSLGDRNRTSAYLRDWRNVQRLKRNSPFSMVASAHLLESNVEQLILVQCVDPFDGLPNVHFHTDLSVQCRWAVSTLLKGGGGDEEDMRRHLNVIRSAVPLPSPPETISFPRHGMNSIFPADPFHPPFPSPSSFSVTVNNFLLYRKENPRDR